MKLRIAIQQKGRLKTDSWQLLARWGLRFTPEARTLIAPCLNADVEVVTLRQSDIPRYVERGIVDFGIVGNNVLREQLRPVQTVQPLGFGSCNLVIAVPNISQITTIEQLQGKRIATSYPNSLQHYLDSIALYAKIVQMSGSVEAAPELDIADAICDLTQTGTTLAAHDLTPIVTVYQSEAVLIAPTNLTQSQQTFIKQYVL
ncbi:MAG: ATP phosphoribosyltransferase [Candidatus Kerfeldbacteria bacterium]|nr:ATP phosphoribosyltransferase [Candidatus Kerfeldbacteria bacterium]